jgi:SSS family solute:Na+ symporter
MIEATAGLRLQPSAIDYAILAAYFVIVLGIGAMARRAVSTSLDFFLSGRSLPAWVTGLAFISANLGAIEILGMAANGAQYGIGTTHYYWIGAIPAMVFLGIVMMPFYYGSRVRSVPEYLRLRFNRPTHLFNALTFALASVLIAGVNLYALALVVNALLGWAHPGGDRRRSADRAGVHDARRLSAAIYNEVLQFFVIVAALIPITVVGLVKVGGWSGLVDSLSARGPEVLNSWHGTSLAATTNPFGDWLGIVFGLGFVLSFGYWTTNFAEVQRALSAKTMRAAQLTPIIGAFPKLLLPFVIVIPGMVAAVLVPTLGTPGGPEYNNALSLLMRDLLPSGSTPRWRR